MPNWYLSWMFNYFFDVTAFRILKWEKRLDLSHKLVSILAIILAIVLDANIRGNSVPDYIWTVEHVGFIIASAVSTLKVMKIGSEAYWKVDEAPDVPGKSTVKLRFKDALNGINEMDTLNDYRRTIVFSVFLSFLTYYENVWDSSHSKNSLFLISFIALWIIIATIEFIVDACTARVSLYISGHTINSYRIFFNELSKSVHAHAQMVIWNMMKRSLFIGGKNQFASSPTGTNNKYKQKKKTRVLVFFSYPLFLTRLAVDLIKSIPMLIPPNTNRLIILKNHPIMRKIINPLKKPPSV